MMGWQDAEWVHAAAAAEKHEGGLIDAIRAASSDPSQGSAA